MRLTVPLVLVIIAAGCSQSGMPKGLETAHVDMARVQPELTRFGGDSRLGLVWGLAQGPADTGVLAVGDALCHIAATDAAAECQTNTIPLESVDATTGADGRVNALIVSGPMGRPSAARLSTRGEVQWRLDADVGNMGSVAVADLADGPAVLISGSDSVAVLDFETGTPRASRPRGRAMLAGDWVGDTRREHIFSADDSSFALIGNDGAIVTSLRTSGGVWPEPVATVAANGQRPFLVTSAGNRLDVYDSLFTKVRRYDATGMVAPLHVVAAAFLGGGPTSPLAVVYRGQNDWHRSVLFVFGTNGAVIYKEVLEDDHHVLRPRNDPTGVTFLLGGRGVVWQYRFPIGI
jgi:hypothetical protein